MCNNAKPRYIFCQRRCIVFHQTSNYVNSAAAVEIIIDHINLTTKDLAMYPIASPDINDAIIGPDIMTDIQDLYSVRKGVVINITVPNPYSNVTLHYNDGITNFSAYNEEK